MVFLRLISAIALSFALSTLGQAQTKVYESTDAEGNPVFSDTPSEGANSMEIPATNIATPVEPEPAGAAVSGGSAAPAGVVAAPEEQARIIVNRDEEERSEGGKWRTEHTENGDILTQEPRRDQPEGATEGDNWRTEHTAEGDILVQEPRHEQLEEIIDDEPVPVERVLRSRRPSTVNRGK